MKLKYGLIAIIFFFLISGCSQPEVKTEPTFRTYTLDSSPGKLTTYTITSEDEDIDLDEQFIKDRAEIESYRGYTAIRNLADREKQEEERIDCYQKYDKDPEEYYLERCED